MVFPFKKEVKSDKRRYSLKKKDVKLVFVLARAPCFDPLLATALLRHGAKPAKTKVGFCNLWYTHPGIDGKICILRCYTQNDAAREPINPLAARSKKSP